MGAKVQQPIIGRVLLQADSCRYSLDATGRQFKLQFKQTSGSLFTLFRLLPLRLASQQTQKTHKRTHTDTRSHTLLHYYTAAVLVRPVVGADGNIRRRPEAKI